MRRKGRALREGINERKIPHFWTGRFPDIKKALASPDGAGWARQKLSQEAIDGFLEVARRTNDGQDADEGCFLCGAAGTLLVFDDRGLHRGGVPRSGDRSILRYNYIPTRYWSEQFTPVRSR